MSAMVAVEADIIAGMDIPAGCLHRTAVIGRGWTGQMINSHLQPVRVAVPDVPAARNVSNKAYQVADVEAAERDVPEVAAHLAKAARAHARRVGTIPRDCDHPHGPDTVTGVEDLASRGWTLAQIHRLLGTDPDWAETVDWGGPPARSGWCTARARTAEETTLALRKAVTARTAAAQAGPSPAQAAARGALADAISSEHLTAVVVPDVTPGASRSWRRVVARVSPGGTSAYAIDGTSVDPGGAALVQPGALIVTCDVLGDRRIVTVLRVTATGWDEIKRWELRAALGARVVAWIERRLEVPSPAVRRVDPLTNKWPGWCHKCRQDVPAGAGIVVGSVRSRIAHKGTCPPLPPLPPKENQWAGWCADCGKGVPARAGVVTPHDTDTSAGVYRRWLVTHRSTADCATARDWLPNESGDWCACCGLWVRPEAGKWDKSRVWHRSDCAPTQIGLWRVSTRYGHRPGATFRTLVTPREGDLPVPAGGPGAHIVDDRTVSVMVTVVDRAATGTGWRCLVRVADPDDAAPHLADEIEAAVSVQPTTSTYRAPWSADRSRGVNPWLAEITGFDAVYGLSRVFLEPDLDYMTANHNSTTGVGHQWVLHPNRVYEASVPLGRKVQRLFVRATDDGGVEEITREQVDAWLLHGSLWALDGGDRG